VSFTLDKDRIELDDDVFSAFNASITGRLGRERFHSGDGETSAADADDRIVYDTATGILYYDADGAGGVPSVPFAIVGESSHPALRGLDFVIAD
jgi:Ca2+-binding RTX toxin-like protein